MSIGSVIVIAVIVIVSVVAVFTAEEPLDEVFAVQAAINGFSMQPLATKVSQVEASRTRSKASGDGAYPGAGLGLSRV